MTTRFQITANDQDLTNLFSQRLIRMSISDEVGTTSDQIQIDIDKRIDPLGNRYASAALPDFGAIGIHFVGEDTSHRAAHRPRPGSMSAEMKAKLSKMNSGVWSEAKVFFKA